MNSFPQTMRTHIIPLLLLLVASGCTGPRLGEPYGPSTDEPAGDSRPDTLYSVFLIGDTGDPVLQGKDPVLQLLDRKLEQRGTRSAVVFLGDNLYPNGLPEKQDPFRERAELRLDAQLETVKGHPGKVFFIPGNHDWGSSGEHGLDNLRRQERYIESRLQQGNVFLPDSGYPGPVSLSLADSTSSPYDLRLIIIDTQWWLYPHEKPLSTGISSETQQRDRMIQNLAEMIEQHGDDEILVAGHHPLLSYGRHGGKFPAKTHLLPPVFGTFYVLYRKTWGYSQDIAHRDYNALRKELAKVFSGKDQLFYASGHEHSLQWIPRKREGNRHYYIVSGSGSRTSFVKKGREPDFTYPGKGFAVIHYFPNRSKKVEYWNSQGRLVFETFLPYPSGE